MALTDRRPWLMTTGIAILALGVAAIVAPEAVPLSVSPNLVPLVAVLALALAYPVFVRRLRAQRTFRRHGDPELPAVRSPADVERIADFYEHDTWKRHHLQCVALDVLTQHGEYSRPEAVRALDRGTWTDDPYAATFLSDSYILEPWFSLPRGDVQTRRSLLDDEYAVDPPATARVRALIAPEPGDDYRYRRAATELDAYTETPLTSRCPLHRRWLRRLSAMSGTERGSDGATGSCPPDGTNTEGDVRTTNHWRGISAVTLACVSVGVLVGNPALILAGSVGVGFAAYTRFARPIQPQLRVERDVSRNRADPGDRVDVTVTVTNESDRVLPDLRLIDGVPAALPVVDGTPRHGAMLLPGASSSFSYAVEARRGTHQFEPLSTCVRGVSGVYETELAVESRTVLSAEPDWRPADGSLRPTDALALDPGEFPTMRGGDGVEFFTVREYRHGDPLGRIDWNRRARTGELTTLTFREYRAATVVLVLDAHEAAYAATEPTAAHTVDRMVEGAGRLVGPLLRDGNRVGLAAFSPLDCWVPPARNRTHRAHVRKQLAESPAFGPTPPASELSYRAWFDRFRYRLPSRAQVVLFSPLTDPLPVELARELDARGWSTTVISPDPTADRTAAQRIAGVARQLRVETLREDGVPVREWAPDESLDAVLARASSGGTA